MEAELRAFDAFRDAVESAGLKAVQYPRGHWQIIGPFRVNVYPFAHKGPTAYVNGTHKAVHVSSLDELVRMATHPPPVGGPKPKRKKNTKQIKRRLLRKNPYCRWCNKRLDQNTATLEHIIPLHRGGSNGTDNLTIACRECNSARGHDMPEKEGAR